MELQLHPPHLDTLSYFYNTVDPSVIPKYGTFDDIAATIVVAIVAMAYLSHGILWDKPEPYLYKMFERPQLRLTLNSSHHSQSANETGVSTRDVALRMEQTAAEIVIFWSSQSGTATKFSHRLARDLRRRFGKTVLVADVADFDPHSLRNIPDRKLVVFIVSTYGEGEPSDNMVAGLWWEWLNVKGEKCLEKLKFAALGLGNSHYKYYNAVVDVLVEGLERRGARVFQAVGRADDAWVGGTEEGYLGWKDSLLETLKREFGFEEREAVYVPSMEVVEDVEVELEDLYIGKEPWTEQNQGSGRSLTLSRSLSVVQPLAVKAARELFHDSADRSCIHMELDLSAHLSLKYKTGDHIGIWPVNPDEEVETLIHTLGLGEMRHLPLKLQASTDCSEHNVGRLKVPSPTTIAALLGRYLEVSAPVSREILAALIPFAPTACAREELKRLSEDTDHYNRLQDRKYITLGRLLHFVADGEGAWRHLPLSFIIEALPAMRPRWYSISSSSVCQPKRVAITAVVVDKILNNGAEANERVKGLCTNYFLALKQEHHGAAAHTIGTRDLDECSSTLPSANAVVFAQIRKSTFKLPALASQPIVMVAAGTGIAPFRAFLQERVRLARMGRALGRMILFFGCRNRDEDFLYEDELHSFQEALGEECFTLITAFSRPNDGSKKMYVQDRIQEHADEVTGLMLDASANFYICGAAAMARDVGKVLGVGIGQKRGWDEEEVKGFTERLRKTKRWQQDVW